MAKPTGSYFSKRRARGFARAASLLETRIRTASESRGFAVTRLLTHWPEIVGEDVARVARPVKIGYGGGGGGNRRDGANGGLDAGLGATLTLLTTGAQAPLLQADLPRIRDRVNACYGYNAIARIRITQTAPTGFAEGQAQFAPAPKHPKPTPVDPAVKAAMQKVSAGIGDDTLRSALATLGENILSRTKR